MRFIACLPLLFADTLIAGPWVGPEDAQLRHHLQILADHKIIKTPLNAWPLNWSNIEQDLSEIARADIPQHIAWSYQYVAFELERQTQSFVASVENYSSTNPNTFTSFGNNNFEENEISADIDIIYDAFTFGINGSYVRDPLDNDKSRFDGSHVAVLLGNWVFGVGAIDRWWGPSWSNSLLLSNNARPVPGVFIKRNYDDATNWPIFEWLGPWQFELFANQLEEERAVSEAWLYGYRTTYRPASFFEFGFARILFDGADEQDIEEPDEGWSEHLSSFDARLSFATRRFIHAIYFELVGQGDDIYKLDDEVGLFGYELSLTQGNASHRLTLEFVNTQAGFLDEQQQAPGIAYSDVVYESGYHFRGRNLGSRFGADSEVVTLRGLHFHLDGWELDWEWINGEINSSSSDNHSLTSAALDINYFNASVSKLVSEKLKAGFEIFYLDSPILLDGINVERDLPELDTGVGINFIYRY